MSSSSTVRSASAFFLLCCAGDVADPALPGATVSSTPRVLPGPGGHDRLAGSGSPGAGRAGSPGRRSASTRPPPSPPPRGSVLLDAWLVEDEQALAGRACPGCVLALAPGPGPRRRSRRAGPGHLRRRLHRTSTSRRLLQGCRPRSAGSSSIRAVESGDHVCDLEARPGMRSFSLTRRSHLAAKVGPGVDLGDIDDDAPQNDLGTAVVRRAAANPGVARVAYASRWWSTARAPTPARCTGRPPAAARGGRPGRRTLRARGAHADPTSSPAGWGSPPRWTRGTSTPRPRSHGEHLAAAWSRETGGRGRRAAVPQRLRPGHAARHPVRRGGVALPPAPSTPGRPPGCSRTAASAATSSTSTTCRPRWWPPSGPTARPA